MKNKNIVIAISSLTGGGAERVASVWANELYEKGCQVTIVLFTRLENEYYTHPNIKILSIASGVEEYKSTPFLERFRILRGYLKELSPDYIISFMAAAQVWMMFASIGMKCKRIETIRVNPWKISVTNFVSKNLWKLTYHTCYKIILQATDQKPWFAKCDWKKCILIPNPISELYVENYKAETSGKVKNFIAAGRIDAQKNYKMMIDGFVAAHEKYTDIDLRIYGTGSESYVNQIQSYIDSKGATEYIRLMGRTPRMEEEYKKADVFLMTSDFEGLPNALMEAMASRLVCVSTDCKTGPKDLIDNGVNGFLISVGASHELSDTICRIVEMPLEERNAIAQAARNKILTYCSKENSVNRLYSLFK